MNDFSEYEEVDSIQYVGMTNSELLSAIESMIMLMQHDCDNTELISKVLKHIDDLMELHLSRAKLMKIVGTKK